MNQRVRNLQLPHSEPARTHWLPWAVCAVLAGAAGWFAYATYANSRGEPAAGSEPSSTPAASADTAPVQPAPTGPPSAAVPDNDIALQAKGYIIPAHQILVSPKVSGMIVTLNIEEGQRLKQGDVIAELENTDYQADRDRAAAGVQRAQATLDRAQARVAEVEAGFRLQERQQAEAELAEATAQLQQLEAEYRRNVELRRGNVVTPQDLEIAESKYLAMKHRVAKLTNALELIRLGERDERRDMARAELRQAEADLQEAKADLAKAQWKLDNCTIQAPISGTVLKKNAEEGNIVNPIAFNGSFSICEMADLSDLEVELHIQERDIRGIFAGQQCVVRPEAYPDDPARVYHGVVSRLMPIADRSKAAIPVRVKLQVPAAEEGQYLKPEMSATVTFRKPEARGK